MRTETAVGRAALAAVLVRDKARELRLKLESLDSWAGFAIVVASMTLGFTIPPSLQARADQVIK